MQTKDRERVNKKTGKVTIVRGSTPLKEGVVVIKEDTTMEQLKHFARCARNAGVSHPCKCSSTVTRDITAIPKTLPLGSPIFTHISFGTGWITKQANPASWTRKPCAKCRPFWLSVWRCRGHLKEADRQGAFGTKRLHHHQTETGSRKGQSRKGCRPCRRGESRSRATIY